MDRTRSELENDDMNNWSDRIDPIEGKDPVGACVRADRPMFLDMKMRTKIGACRFPRLGYADCCSQRSDTFMGTWHDYLRCVGDDRSSLLYSIHSPSGGHCSRSLLVDNEL